MFNRIMADQQRPRLNRISEASRKSFTNKSVTFLAVLEAPLPAELSEMMVGVQIAPAKPVLSTHRTKDGVRGGKASIRAPESLEDSQQRLPILIQPNGRRASQALLDFRPRPNAVGPLCWEAEGDPLDESPLEKSARGTHVLLTQSGQVGISQVAEHLLDRHPSPSGEIGSSHLTKARGDPITLCLGIESSQTIGPAA